MSVALLLITHECIGTDLLRITASILNDDPKNTVCIEIPMDSDTAEMAQVIASAIDTLDTAQGMLMLTDSFGSTPCNLAAEFLDHQQRALVSGLNLPMLLRIMNYRQRPLNQLTEIAVEGGKRGITASS